VLADNGAAESQQKPTSARSSKTPL
jgi:hypothetical protein